MYIDIQRHTPLPKVERGGYAQLEIHQRYLNQIAEDIHFSDSIKIVIDGSNGPAGNLSAQLLRQLGCEVITINSEIDGTFPGHSPDTSNPRKFPTPQR